MLGLGSESREYKKDRLGICDIPAMLFVLTVLAAFGAAENVRRGSGLAKYAVTTAIITGIGFGGYYHYSKSSAAKQAYEVTYVKANKLADTNSNSILSLEEQAGLWKNSGRTTPFFENQPQQLKDLKTSELEMAITKYNAR